MGNWQDYVNNKYAKKKETEPGGTSARGTETVRNANMERLNAIRRQEELKTSTRGALDRIGQLAKQAAKAERQRKLEALGGDGILGTGVFGTRYNLGGIERVKALTDFAERFQREPERRNVVDMLAYWGGPDRERDINSRALEGVLARNRQRIEEQAETAEKTRIEAEEAEKRRVSELTASNQLIGNPFSAKDYVPKELPGVGIPSGQNATLEDLLKRSPLDEMNLPEDVNQMALAQLLEKNTGRASEEEVERYEQEQAGNFEMGEWAGASLAKGWTRIGGRAMQYINASMEPIQEAMGDATSWITRKVFGDHVGDMTDYAIDAVKDSKAVSDTVYNWAVDPMRKAEEYSAYVDEKSGYWAKIGSEVIANAVEMIPNTAIALISGGASAATDAFNRAQMTFGGAVVDSAKKMATSPNFLLSFGQMYGGRYEDAIAGGADPYAAALVSTITTLMNAAVESGSGIEELPFTKATVGDWVKMALDEGKEEAVQQVIDQLGQKMIAGESVPWYSMEDENAVVNPKVLGESALIGALAGGVIGGPGMAVNNVLNRNMQEQTEDFSGAPAISDEAMKLIQEENEAGLEPLKNAPENEDKSAKYPRISKEETEENIIRQMAQEAADRQIEEQAKENATASRPAPHQPAAQTASTQSAANERTIEAAVQRAGEQGGEIRRMAEAYGEDASVFASHYQGGDAETYRRGFDAMYTAGMSGLRLEQIGETTGELTRGMDEAVKRAIWQAGSNSAARTVTPGVKKLYTVRVSGVQKRQFRMLDEIGRRYGYEFDIVDSIDSGRVNAAVRPGRKRIVVAADAAEGAIVQAGVHELVHSLKATDADAYGVVEEVVLKHLQAEDSMFNLDWSVNQRIEAYAAHGQTLTREQAIEEIVAEAAPTFLTDRDAVEAFVRRDRTTAEKVRDFFVNFAKEIREIAERYMQRDGNERDEIANLIGKSEALKEIAETLDWALESAGKKWADMPTTGIELGAETKYSVNERKVIEGYLEAVDPKILEAAKMYRDDRNAKFGRYKLGDVQEREIREIKELLGIDVSGYSHSIDKNGFNHIEKRHGSDGDADQTMADLNDVARLGWVLGHFDSVERAVDKNGNPVYAKGYLDSEGNPAPVIVYRKKINGIFYVSEAVADGKWKKLWVTTAFMSENKKDASQTPNTSNEAPGYTSENESAAASDLSIIDTEQKVNSDAKFSLNNTSSVDSLTDENGKLDAPDVDTTVPDAAAVIRQAAKAVREGISERMELQITGVANKILKETGSGYAKADFIQNMKDLIKEYAKNGATEDTLRAVSEMAKKIIGESRRVDNSLREQYADLRKKLRETGISLTETQKQEAANEAGSYDTYRRSLMGTVKLTNDGISLDAIWGELSSQHPELFPAGTGEAEMVGRLTDFMLLMKPKYENPYGMDMDGAALEMALRIQGDIMGIIGAKEAAQKLYGDARKIRDQFEKDFKARLKEQRKARVEKFQQIAGDLKAAKAAGDAKEQAKVMSRYRAAMKASGLDEAYAEVRATYKAREERKAENRKANEMRERVAAKASELMKMLAKPEKGRRVPSGLQKLVLDALEMLDINGTRAAAEGRETQKAAAFRENLNGIRQFYEEVWDKQSKGETPAGMDGLMMTISERNLKAMQDALDMLGGGDQFLLRDMTSNQLRVLDELLENIRHTVESVGKLWKIHRYQSVVELGDKSIEEMGERGERRFTEDTIGGAARDFMALNMLEPVSYGERLGEGGSAIIQGLMDGEKIKFSRIREAAAATKKMLKEVKVTGYDIGRWKKHVQEVKLGSGQTLKMTDTQLMSLYLTAKRPQGMQHLLANGMKIPESRRTGAQTGRVDLTQADIAKMGTLLTKEQRALADRMGKFLSTDAAKWGNDVTQRLYLYDAFTEANYWPLSSDPNSLMTEEPERDRAFNAILNAGFTKPLNAKANNALVIMDAFDVFGKHVAEMASYAGYAEVMTDTLAWLNYKRRTDEGLIDGSVKESIEKLLGKGGQEYLTRLIQDINGSRRGGGNTQLNRLTGNVKLAAVAGKIRVAIQQPMSIVRAAAEINPIYLIKSMRLTKGFDMKDGFREWAKGNQTVEEMQKWSSLAWWKGNGNYEIGIGKSTDEIFWGDTAIADTVMEKITTSGGLVDPGRLDDLTWAHMWIAVKEEIKRKRKDLTVGSDEYFRAVAERFEFIMDRTQVVDTVMHRSDMMRSKDGAYKSLTAFMSEPTKSYNMMARAIMDAGRDPKNKKAWKKLTAVSFAYVVSAAATAAATAMFDAFKYRDDEDDIWTYLMQGGLAQDWTERFLKNFLSNVNPLENTPIVSEIYAAVTKQETPSIMGFEGFVELKKSWDNIYNYVFEGNTKKLTAYGAVAPAAKAASNLAGLPLSGMMANAEALVHIYDPKLMQTKSDMQTSKATYEKLYEATVNGDRKKALSIRTELAKGMYGNTAKSKKEIDSGVARVLAMEDERILKAWQMRGKGNQTKELIALYKEIQKDGFTDEQVKYATNSVESLMNSRYNELIEEGKTGEAEALAGKMRKYGMEPEAAKEKDLDAELEAKTFEYKHLYAAIRNGDTDDAYDAAEIMELESDAKNPAQAIKNAVSGEFRKEYIELVRSGKKKQAEELGRKLELFGIDEEYRTEWMKDDYREEMKEAVTEGDMKTAERAIDELRSEYGLTDVNIASSLNSEFRDQYIELVVSGKNREADALAEKLQDLGLRKSNGENCFRQSYLNDWVKAWEKDQEAK